MSLGEFSELSENGRPFFLFSIIQSFMAGFFYVLILFNKPQLFYSINSPEQRIKRLAMLQETAWRCTLLAENSI